MNLKDRDYFIPLWWPAERGHETVVELLLGTSKVDVKLKNKYTWNGLCIVAIRGHDSVSICCLTQATPSRRIGRVERRSVRQIVMGRRV